MQTIDDIIAATIRSVRASGMLTENVIMGVVSAVGTNGTITVKRPGQLATLGMPDVADDVYPKVRLLGTLTRPQVGDKVEIVNSQSGWLCLGVLQTSNAPHVQSGSFTQNGNTGKWTNNVTITFPKAFAVPPQVVVMCTSGASATTSGVMAYAAASVTTTTFDFRHWRDNTGTGTFSWIATDL